MKAYASIPENRLHKEVFGGRVHPLLFGFIEKDISTPRGEGLKCCWELICCGGEVRDVVSFLKVQNNRLSQRVTAILRTRHSTWIVDVKGKDTRITHFKVYVPRAGNVSLAMKRFWAKRKGAAKPFDADTDRKCTEILHVIRQTGRLP
jgi:hypothetical protein